MKILLLVCRFSQFFLCPLFTASATEREVNAVHSENDKNLQSDQWRLMQLEKSLANPDHDYSKFGTGMYMYTAVACAQECILLNPWPTQDMTTSSCSYFLTNLDNSCNKLRKDTCKHRSW